MSRESVSQEQTAEQNYQHNGTESKKPQPVSKELGSHMVEVSMTLGRSGRIDVTIARENRSGSTVIFAFVNTSCKAIPAV
tara:strand:+ start:576 stop:815 length:240 start_codon:yes stop_codon:yes gene_type:complete